MLFGWRMDETTSLRFDRPQTRPNGCPAFSATQPDRFASAAAHALALSPRHRARAGRRSWPVAVFIPPAASAQRGAICSNLSSLRTSVRYVPWLRHVPVSPVTSVCVPRRLDVGWLYQAALLGASHAGVAPGCQHKWLVQVRLASRTRGAFIARSTKRGPLARQSCRATCPAASRIRAGSAGKVLCGPAPVRSPAASCFPPRRAFRAYPMLRARINQSNPALNRTAQKRRFALLLGSRLALRLGAPCQGTVFQGVQVPSGNFRSGR